MRKLLPFLFILLFVDACATSTGKKISEDQLSFVREGETTYDQVVKKFGPPDEEVKESNGTKEIFYRFNSYRSDPKTFIPILGPLLAHDESESHYVSFTFDPENVVQQFHVRKIQATTNTTF